MGRFVGKEIVNETDMREIKCVYLFNKSRMP